MSEQKMPALPEWCEIGGALCIARGTVQRIQREAYEAGRQHEREAIFSGKYHEPLTLLDPAHNQCYSAGWEAAMIDCKRAERERLEPLRVAVEAWSKEVAIYSAALASDPFWADDRNMDDASRGVLSTARTLLEQTE